MTNKKLREFILDWIVKWGPLKIVSDNAYTELIEWLDNNYQPAMIAKTARRKIADIAAENHRLQGKLKEAERLIRMISTPSKSD